MSNELLEARSMVESLRVVELRCLLSMMGKVKNGLKKELVQRAIEFLQRECEPELLSTIRELYRLRHSISDPGSRGSDVIAKLAAAMPSADGHNKLKPIPEMQMMKMPFYHTLETIVPPTTLVPVTVNISQSSYLTFNLTQQQWAQINNLQGSQAFQVVLRFCYTESIGVEEDQYPPRITVYVNGLHCIVQARYASGKEGVEPSRPCCPINLTPLLNQSSDNLVCVLWDNFGKDYSAAVYLVRVYSSVELLEQLQTKAMESQENCRQKIYDKLHGDLESEVATTGLQVSLLCPLAKTRMSTPCRAQSCAHLQCFDAAFYLQMNERKPSWTCPVCHKSARFETLRIDSLMKSILQSTKEDVEGIEYLLNASWKVLEEERKCSKKTSPLHIDNGPVSLDIVDLTQDSSDDDSDISDTQQEEKTVSNT